MKEISGLPNLHVFRRRAFLILLLASFSFFSSSAAKQLQQAPEQDCEKVKKELQSLQELLGKTLDQVRAEQQAMAKLDRSIEQVDQILKDIDGITTLQLLPTGLPFYYQTKKHLENIRDLRAKLESARKQLNNNIGDELRTIGAIKDQIDDLLSKVGDCSSKTDDATKNFVDCLEKQGAERDLTDSDRAYNPKTGQNFVWDKNKKSWIDIKTGECVCPKCPVTTGPATVPSPKPSPTSNPTPTPTPAQNTNNQVGYHVDSNTANGLYVTTITTPQGKIKVNLTDDIAAGDTIAGTVETEPAGRNDVERGQNQTQLNGYVVELEGQKTKVGDKKIFCNIPSVLTPEARNITFQYQGQIVVITQLPILTMPPPTPTQLTLPTGGQQGRTLECFGNFVTTDQVKVGGLVMPQLALSPRKMVVNNTSQTVGPTTIECGQHGIISQCPFRNLGIKLFAPKLDLVRGERTTLHVTVTGLSGITQDVPLDLVDNTPNVISMSGGDVQHLTIQPTGVRGDGTFAFDRTLTGITTGAFGVTATVKWDDACKRPPN